MSVSGEENRVLEKKECRGGSYFVDEDDRRSILPSHPKHVPDHPRSFSQILLNKLGSIDSNERSSRVVSDGFDEHRLARTGGTVEEDTSRRVDTDLTVEVELSQGEFDGFSDLLLLNVHSSDIRVFTIGRRRNRAQLCARV